jgi:hypothetical protein
LSLGGGDILITFQQGQGPMAEGPWLTVGGSLRSPWGGDFCQVNIQP